LLSTYMEKISIAIIARNESQNITRLFESLRKLDYPKSDLEVVLIDDASDDDTGKIGRKYGANVFRNSVCKGRAHARNVALAHARHDIIAWIDADCEIADPSWLKDMLKYLKGTVAGVAGTHVYPKGGSLMQKAIWCIPGMHVESKSAVETRNAPTTSSVFLKKALLEAGGFDENLTTGEDLEMCWRLARKGWKLMLIPGGRIIHHYRPGPWKFFNQQLEYGREGAKLARERFGMAVPVCFAGALLGVLAGLYFYPVQAAAALLLAVVCFQFALGRPAFIPFAVLKSLSQEMNPMLPVAVWALEVEKNIAVSLGFVKGLLKV
jgi:cellulose synthase/poly-beta-1,6-N-acetylglucosamine synthase-like glycosyltransferase